MRLNVPSIIRQINKFAWLRDVNYKVIYLFFFFY